jgi:hypothetical protein
VAVIPMQNAAREISQVLRAATPTHAHLRARVVAVAGITLLVDIVATVAMFMFERHAEGTQIKTMFDSFFWTSSQLSTVSSSIANPLTKGGRLLAIGIDIYSITVVATLAGSFSAFFHKRGWERAQEAGLEHLHPPA